MSVLIDSYSESNQDDYTYLDSAEGFGIAQTFNGDGSTLDSAKFRIGKTGSPTGNAVAKIYAITGTYGTNSKPTGAALATSDPIDVTTIASGLPPANLYLFTFSGANQIVLTSGTKYAVALEYTGGDVSNKIAGGRDNTSPTHAGDGSSESTGGTWTSRTYDNIFYIYGNPPGSGPINAASTPGVSISLKDSVVAY